MSKINMNELDQDEVGVDYLAYVKDAIKHIPRGGMTRVAAKAGVSVRTLQLVAGKRNNFHYQTIMSLYAVLKGMEMGRDPYAKEESA